MSKRKKYHELSPEEKSAKRAKAEAMAEKAYNQDIKRSKYFTYIMVFMVVAIIVGSFIVPRSGTGKGGNFHVAIPVDDVSLDPQKSTNSWEAGTCSLIYEGLVKFDKNLVLEQNLEALNFGANVEEEISRYNVEPALATSWQYNEKDNTWTFTLREGVFFHDNSEFTAASVVASFARLMGFDDVTVDTSRDFPIRKLYSALNKVYKIGDYEVVFELSVPDPLFLQKLALPQASIMSSQLLSKEITSQLDLSVKTSGTGPYTLASKMGDDFVVLLRNDRYWGKTAYPGVNIFLLGSDRAAFQAIDSGELDMILAGSVLTATTADGYDNLNVVKGYSRFVSSVVMNPNANCKTAQLLANKELREIVFNSLNSYEFLEKDLFEFFDANMLPIANNKKRDPEKILKIAEGLQTQKFTDSDKIELELTFPIMQSGFLPDLSTLAQAIKDQLSDVNIDVKFVILPEENYFQEWLEGNIAFTFADFSDDWFYSFENFYGCAFADKKDENSKQFLAVKDVQDVIILRKKLSDEFCFKQIGHLLRAHILEKSVAGKAPEEIQSFFDLLKTAE